ncbi:MAG: tetratricopeptide repeat protein [Planctomycetes bacterium]|nr:tetratricopeptide repeat protein [Planctomycetota bacterium]
MTRAALLLLLLLSAPLWAGEKEDSTAVYDAIKSEKWLEALKRAEAFVANYPKSPESAAISLAAWPAGVRARRPARSVALLQAALKQRLDESMASGLHGALIEATFAAGMVAECLELISERQPDEQDDADAFYAAECRFHLGEFEAAETGLKALVAKGSEYAHDASARLAQINPPLKVDENGIVLGYTGKYEHDSRFKRALANLPGYIARANSVLKQTLGVELPAAPTVFEFRDMGMVYDTARAFAEPICLGYKPYTRIVFYTEHVVLSEPEFALRVIHELKHAAFRAAMGARYSALPVWVKEGLAVYGAGQLADRLALVVRDRVFGGKEPLEVLRGIELDDRSEDYAESALAFAWLESLGAGNVKKFCEGLLKGEQWDALLAAVSGARATDALVAAQAWSRKHLSQLLGDAGEQLMVIIRDEYAARSRTDGQAWLKDGVPRYQAWLKANPSHLLAPNAMYRIGTGLVDQEDFEAGCTLLRRITIEYQESTSFCDDAQHRIGHAYRMAGNTEAARREFGVLLRDYSWCRYASSIALLYKAAGPVRDDDAD